MHNVEDITQSVKESVGTVVDAVDNGAVAVQSLNDLLRLCVGEVLDGLLYPRGRSLHLFHSHGLHKILHWRTVQVQLV